MNEVTGILAKAIDERRDAIREALRSGVVDIKFEKADGSERKMRATTNADLINETLEFEGLPLLAEDYLSEDMDDHPTYQCVYDLDIPGWRGFVWSRLETAESESSGSL